MVADPEIDIIAPYRILSARNEEWPAYSSFQQPPGELEDRLTGGCFGNSRLFGGWTPTRNSCHCSSLLSNLGNIFYIFSFLGIGNPES
jgi:hypothetical protein